eukprot:SAG31_NODE_37983_length_300_cov_0.616915_1_plen_63_part_10
MIAIALLAVGKEDQLRTVRTCAFNNKRTMEDKFDRQDHAWAGRACRCLPNTGGNSIGPRSFFF